jgi:polyribonucleotide nucleotidyltransferase
MEKKSITITVDGSDLVFETGKIAKQANGSVFLHCNETSILATACASTTASEEIDFFPLRVDYQEKFSSVGKTASGFIKREGRPVAHNILTSRFIDRSIRPLFPNGYYNEVQVFAYVYSYDGMTSPDVLGICAASAALVISDIPFIKPIGAVRVGLIDNEFIINPTSEQQKTSQLDLVLAGSEDAILMIEGFCDFLTEEQTLEAIDKGHSAIKEICVGLKKWREEIGKEKNTSTIKPIPQELHDEIEASCQKEITHALTIAEKDVREKKFSEVKEELLLKLFPEDEKPKFLKRDVMTAFKAFSSKKMRESVFNNNKRIDGRDFDEIRPIDIETGLLPRTHGSALFTRGETQAIAVCTLGGETMGQRYEDLHGDGLHRFYLQYFFPPFCVGEVGRSGPPGRREIGHGMLAERAIAQSLPKQEDFPYVIRLESNITESNGSSSMASVCGGCLSLMNAGVPITRPVSGIAMGLILLEDGSYTILSDILGAEDALGDMDFKITGDADGITAFQMDIKVEGITHDIMAKALTQAKKGRIHILEKMLSVCPQSNKKMSKYAPRIVSIKIKPSQIGTVIGPGGKQIRAIIEETGVEIDITDEGIVNIVSNDEEGMTKAQNIVKELTEEVEKGKTYKGKIVSIKAFGLFVQLPGGKEGLCHISEVSHSRIDDLTKIFKEGDMIEVIVIDINDRGQIKLSHKALLEK